MIPGAGPRQVSKGGIKLTIGFHAGTGRGMLLGITVSCIDMRRTHGGLCTRLRS